MGINFLHHVLINDDDKANGKCAGIYLDMYYFGWIKVIKQNWYIYIHTHTRRITKPFQKKKKICEALDLHIYCISVYTCAKNIRATDACICISDLCDIGRACMMYIVMHEISLVQYFAFASLIACFLFFS